MKGPEEFTLNLDGRQTRRTGIRFADDKVPTLNEAIQESLGDLLKAQGDISFVRGVKDAVKAFAYFLHESDLYKSSWHGMELEPWLAHVVARSPNCTCTIDYSGYDSDYEIEYCPWYEDKANQRLWYLAYYGITEEELREQEREAQRKKAAEAERQAAARRQAEYEQLLTLAAKFDVDPKYLP